MSDGEATRVVALDIGGANLKASDGRDFHASRYFPLWKNPAGLADAIRELLADAPRAERYVATMTGELADCFRTKREGVAAICDAAAAACGAGLEIYLTDGTFVSVEQAKLRYPEAAASNWHATAALVARWSPDESGIVVDCGSTTCDIIPFGRGRVRAVGRTDTERLVSRELVYTGVVRSPICAVAGGLPVGKDVAPVAKELFATMLDVYVLLGLLPEDGDNLDTADGRPATIEFAHDRLARSICADRESFDLAAARRAAEHAKESQVSEVAAAIRSIRDRWIPPLEAAYICGQGEFLVREALKKIGWSACVRSFAEAFGEQASKVGPAFALARPASEPADKNRRFPRRVVKIGGSLYESETWIDDLTRWLASQSPATTVLVCGGGKEIERVIGDQGCEYFSDGTAHWRCIRIMRDHACKLTEQVPAWRWFAHWDELNDAGAPGRILVLDAYWFMNEVDARLGNGALPWSWDVSSDSIAARAAELLDAEELVLLKSALPDDRREDDEYVDRYFYEAARGIPEVRFVNLRDSAFPEVRMP